MYYNVIPLMDAIRLTSSAHVSGVDGCSESDSGMCARFENKLASVLINRVGARDTAAIFYPSQFRIGPCTVLSQSTTHRMIFTVRNLGSIGLVTMLLAALPTFTACTSSDPCPPTNGGCDYSTGPPTPEGRALRLGLALGRAEVRADQKAVHRLLCPGAKVEWPIGDLPPRAHVDIDVYYPTSDGWDVKILLSKATSVSSTSETDLESTRTVHISTAHKVMCVENVS
jgi:hypothetical protein